MAAKNYQAFWANIPSTPSEIAEALNWVIEHHKESNDLEGLLRQFSDAEDFSDMFKHFSEFTVNELEKTASALFDSIFSKAKH